MSLISVCEESICNNIRIFDNVPIAYRNRYTKTLSQLVPYKNIYLKQNKIEKCTESLNYSIFHQTKIKYYLRILINLDSYNNKFIYAQYDESIRSNVNCTRNVMKDIPKQSLIKVLISHILE